MPRLKNERRERFVRNYIKTGIATKAYYDAGYRPHCYDVAKALASRLLTFENVQCRIAEVRMGIAKRADCTEDAIINELDETRSHALSVDQCGPAVQATVTKAKIAGLLVEKREIGTPGDFATAKNREDLQRLVLQRLGNDDGQTLLDTLRLIAQRKANGQTD